MRRIWLVLFCLAATPAFSSNTLSGVVIDADTRVPIAGADVAIRLGHVSIHLDETRTDAAGAFTFGIGTAGVYSVEAAAAGYFGTEFYSRPVDVTFDETDLAGRGVNRSVTVAISRAAVITGQIKDGATEQPLADFSVRLRRVTWSRGHRRFSDLAVGSTDEKGFFRIKAAPGDYLLEVWKAPAPNQVLPLRQPDYSEKSPPPKLYPVTFWPPGDPETVVPVTVRSGDEFNAGSISVSKIQLGRIRGAVSRAHCDVGQTALVTFELASTHDTITRGDIVAPCGSNFTIVNLSPGEYRILTSLFFDPPPRIEAATVHIGEATDIDLNLSVEPAVDVAVKINCECAEGWQDKIRGIRIIPGPAATIGSQITRTEADTFHVVGTFTNHVTFAVDQMPAGMVMKSGNTFVLNGFAPSQSHTIILTDRPAHLSGNVSQAGAHIAVANWPLSMSDDFADYIATEVNEHGDFTIALAPGTWRAVAIDAADWHRVEMPNVLARWLASADEFTVAANETKVLPLDAKPLQ